MPKSLERNLFLKWPRANSFVSAFLVSLLYLEKEWSFLLSFSFTTKQQSILRFLEAVLFNFFKKQNIFLNISKEPWVISWGTALLFKIRFGEYIWTFEIHQQSINGDFQWPIKCTLRIQTIEKLQFSNFGSNKLHQPYLRFQMFSKPNRFITSFTKVWKILWCKFYGISMRIQSLDCI